MLGPIGFVRRYLRKVRVVGAALLDGLPDVLGDLEVAPARVLGSPGKGGFPTFGQAVDLVIGSVVSWTPLAADYTRFARTRRGAALGAGIGYFVPTIWCIGLGVLIVLARGVSDAQALPAAVAAAGGIAFVALFAITIDESEKAFADIYSTAVSLQNFLPRVSQRLLITLVSALATGLALALNLGNYQNFLYLLGSFFVPLFGVLVADWLAGGRTTRRSTCSTTSTGDRRRSSPGSSASPVPVAVAGRAGVVDAARRAHASRQRQLHRVVAELRRGVRARRSSSRRSPVQLAVIGHLSRDVVAGGAPRIGGAPWHAARALRALGADARIVAKCGEADAIEFTRRARDPRASRSSSSSASGRRRSRSRMTRAACAR